MLDDRLDYREVKIAKEFFKVSTNMENFLNIIRNIIYLAILIFILLINFNSHKYIFSIFMVIGVVSYIYNLNK